MAPRRVALFAILTGLVSAAVTLATAELVAVFTGAGGSPLVAVGGFVIDIVPPGVKDTVIALFGTGDKLVLLVSLGIAVALLGRNKAVGILFAALLFAALQVGTSTRQLDPEVFDPELATDLATMIQALVIFFVGAELLIVYIWQARRYLPGRSARPEGSA